MKRSHGVDEPVSSADTGLSFMKKSYLSLILIFLAHFFTMNLVCCGEDFFIDSTFVESKNKVKIPAQKVAQSIEKTKKKGFFSKQTKKVRFNYATNEEEEIPQGYYGTLPNIEEDFAYKKQSSPTSKEIDIKVPDEAELTEENLKPAPFDDALFLDMIIKKEPDSEYVQDIQKTKQVLTNLKKCIEEQGDIQRFNANVNMVELHVQNLKKKYDDKSESFKESYIDVLNTNYYAKLLGNLKYDANYYARYIPTTEGKYSKENILKEEENLLNRINKTLFLLNNES